MKMWHVYLANGTDIFLTAWGWETFSTEPGMIYFRDDKDCHVACFAPHTWLAVVDAEKECNVTKGPELKGA